MTPIVQNTLPGEEPTEEDLMNQAIQQPLSEKVQQSVELLQQFENVALSMQNDGFWLAYSGGKDSNCLLELARMAGVQFRPVYSVTTLDPPELIWYMKQEHPEVEFLHPKQSLLHMMVNHPACKGPPTRLARWCCEEFKERGGKGYLKVIGVRASESSKRSKMWKMVQSHHNIGKVICPLVYWTENDVWTFHKQRNLSYCCLYDEGFARLGCVGCPLSSTSKQKKEFERWPEFERMWQQAFKRFFNKWTSTTNRHGDQRWFEDFGDWEGLWKWWISGGKENMSNDCQGKNLFT